MSTVSRETLSRTPVRPILFRNYLCYGIGTGQKTSTRRVIVEDNTVISAGTFAGIRWETGRVRAYQPQAELRAQCQFESGRVRVVSILSKVRPGDLFYVKQGRFGSRAGSTLTLDVKRVRVARLQDMTEADALAEGVAWVPDKLQRDTARETFAALWNELGGSWQANPWVWVYDFHGHNLNVDRYLAEIRGL